MGFTIVNDGTTMTADDLSAVRYGSQGAAEAGIREYLAGTRVDLPMNLDPSGFTAVHSAVCKILGLTRDKVTDHLQVAVKKDGKVTFKNLKKGESAGNRETRIVQTHSYSRETRIAGMVTFCEQYGLTFGIDLKVSLPTAGLKRYGFVKVVTVS